jgi:hypothetical protein
VGAIFIEGILVEIPSKIELRLVYAFVGNWWLGFQNGEIKSAGGFPPVSHREIP